MSTENTIYNFTSMHSFIIISKNKDKTREAAQKMVADLNISKFDKFVLETEKSVGITDIRTISKQMFLKPLKGNQKAVILEAFLGMTVDSQNAFLKVLEEPPLSTTIIILANSNFFLPTVLSRCKLIEIDKGFSLTGNEQKEYSKILEKLKNASAGDKLKMAQDLSKDKETALQFIEKLIITAREKMINNEKGRGEYKKNIEVLNKYYNEIKKSNVNLRLGLENMFLDI